MALREGFDAIDWDSLMALYTETDGVIGLARAGNLEKIQRAFRPSYYILTAWDGETMLMQTLMEKHASLLIGLTSSFEGIEFYKSLGFRKHKTGMAKYPGESIYLEDDQTGKCLMADTQSLSIFTKVFVDKLRDSGQLDISSFWYSLKSE